MIRWVACRSSTQFLCDNSYRWWWVCLIRMSQPMRHWLVKFCLSMTNWSITIGFLSMTGSKKFCRKSRLGRRLLRISVVVVDHWIPIVAGNLVSVRCCSLVWQDQHFGWLLLWNSRWISSSFDENSRWIPSSVDENSRWISSSVDDSSRARCVVSMDVVNCMHRVP